MPNWPLPEIVFEGRPELEGLYRPPAITQCPFKYGGGVHITWSHGAKNQTLSGSDTNNETFYLCELENDSVHWCLTTVTRMK